MYYIGYAKEVEEITEKLEKKFPKNNNFLQYFQKQQFADVL